MLENIDIDIFINYFVPNLTLTHIKQIKNTNWSYNRYIKYLVRLYDIKIIKSLTIKNISSYYKKENNIKAYLELFPKTDTKLPLTYILKNRKNLTTKVLFGGSEIPQLDTELFHIEHQPINDNVIKVMNDIKDDICSCCNINYDEYDDNKIEKYYFKSIFNKDKELIKKKILLKYKKNESFPITTIDGQYIPFDKLKLLQFKNVNIIFKLHSLWINKDYRDNQTKLQVELYNIFQDRKILHIKTDRIYPQFRIIAMEVLEPIELTFPKQISNSISNYEAQNRILKSITDLDKTFPNILKECGAMITGSYLLQQIHNINYNTDIDIFCPTKSVFYLQTCLSKLISPEPMIVNRCLSFNNNYSLKKIKVVMDIEFKGKLIQIIAIDDTNINDYIENYFDLSFCKIRTDGTNIYPNDLTNIYNKVGTCELNSYPKIDRIKKYVERGYIFNFTMNGILLNNML